MSNPVDTDATVQSRAVMLVGHGTRDPSGTEQFFELGRRLGDLVAPMPVAACLLEFQHPTIPEAWDQLVRSGATHVHIVPLLLFAAGHAKQDIPELVRACQQETPGISFDQSRPLSRHPAVVELVVQRITETMQSSPPVDPGQAALLMVGRGSYDPCAQADMRVLTEVVAWRTKFARTATAFYAMAEPKLKDELLKLVAEGWPAVVIQPHLLFQGRLFDAICQIVAEVAEENPATRFITASYLGPELLIAKAIASRATEHQSSPPEN